MFSCSFQKGCGEVVDKYVEYDTMLVVIDLIIHNISAYRHLLYNMRIQVWNLEEKGVIIETFC